MVRRRRKEGIPRHEIAAAITAVSKAMEIPHHKERIQRNTFGTNCTSRVSLRDKRAGLWILRSMRRVKHGLYMQSCFDASNLMTCQSSIDRRCRGATQQLVHL